MLKFFLKKISHKLCTVSVVCIPIKSPNISFLRSPNRSKSSQILLKSPKYKILILINLPIINTKSIHTTPTFIIFLIKKGVREFKFFETNNLFLKNLKIYLKYNYNLV